MDRTPDIFLPYQKLWTEDKSELKVCVKSRRIGITWAEAADDVLLASRSDGMDCYYIGYDEDMTKEYIETIAEWARFFNLAASNINVEILDEQKDTRVFWVDFHSGFKIQALSSMPRNLRGKQGRIVIDEAAFHDDLAALIKAAMATTIWGGSVAVISSHHGIDNSFAKLVEDIRAGRRPGSVHQYTFDEAIEQGLAERVFYIKGQEYTKEAADAWVKSVYAFYADDADEELRCIPAKSGGKYLDVGLIEDCMYDAPVFRLEYDKEFTWKPNAYREAEVLAWCNESLLPELKKLDQSRLHVLGEDFGRKSDMTALVPLEITQTLRRRCPFVVELRNVPYDQQKQIVFYLLDRLPRFVKAAFDATGNGEQLAEVTAQHYGKTRAESIKFNDSTSQEIFTPFKAALQDHMLMLPRDDQIKDDLRLVEVINGVPKIPSARTTAKNNKGQTVYRHGDVAIAAALAYRASKGNYVEYDYKPAVWNEIRKQGLQDMQPRTTAGFGRKKGIW